MKSFQKTRLESKSFRFKDLQNEKGCKQIFQTKFFKVVEKIVLQYKKVSEVTLILFLSRNNNILEKLKLKKKFEEIYYFFTLLENL